jgi:hypothetical protein
VCDFDEVTCHGCQRPFPRKALRAHQSHDCSVVCSRCGDHVQTIEWEEHAHPEPATLFCRGFCFCPNECRLVRVGVFRQDLSLFDSPLSRDNEGRASQVRRSEQQITAHCAVCPRERVACPECKSFLERKELATHQADVCQETRVRCVSCGSQMRRAQFVIHALPLVGLKCQGFQFCPNECKYVSATVDFVAVSLLLSLLRFRFRSAIDRRCGFTPVYVCIGTRIMKPLKSFVPMRRCRSIVSCALSSR